MRYAFPRTIVMPSPGRGRGVFAATAFSAGETIDRQHVAVVPASELHLINTVTLGEFYYEWGPDDTDGAIVLGTFSLVNHSYTPNVRYDVDTFAGGFPAMKFTAMRDISALEELFINYNGNDAGTEGGPLGFTPV